MKRKAADHLESFSETINLPSDILAGASIMTIMGQREVCIENYKGIIEYTREKIRVQTKTGRIHIEGRGLNIKYYTGDDMKVTGFISTIQFLD